ncbi:EAL domain-containing protein [Dankookia sp. GCM10030260]|uniref:EAL domain-containing protein n=1 Tax=Dankookia sp. GCM10030260 TaxID=3273390 RepID=UPI00361CD1DA
MDRPLAVATGLLDRALRRRLATDLRGALGRGELTLHYQPSIRLADGRRCGAEALLRWHHAGRGAVPPATFIPVAEGSDLIVEIGGWALRRAAADAARHPELGRVSVNVSVRQLAAGRLPGQVDRALAESGLAPERLELELTETLPLEAEPRAAGVLRRLRDRGIGLALDDFGAGYASFARLRRLPFSALKLDTSLLAPLAGPAPGHAADLAILLAIRDLGRALRLRLVAEGVETPAQHDAVADLGFDEAQGYLFGAPMPLEALLAADPAPVRLAPPAGAPSTLAPL